MVKVITYGTYDLLHVGHIRLLERAKILGDYLMVGVTADDFDKSRGKINVQQTLMECIEAVKSTGLADEIIIEEYEGQKIDDIKRYDIDIFTVGSDWEGKFDYLKEYCKVVYLDRTQGVSSSSLRGKKRGLKLGLVGESAVLNKFALEATYINGINICGICTLNDKNLSDRLKSLPKVTKEFGELLDKVDAVYIASHPQKHYEQVKQALANRKHVLCESPISMNAKDCRALYQLAEDNGVILAEAIKTAYSLAYSRLMLLLKSGKIGQVISVDATCTSLQEISTENDSLSITWNSFCAWGPTAMLPIFQLLGLQFIQKKIISWGLKERKTFDLFSKIEFVYPNAVASIKIGKGVKSEGELIISGTNGYVYVPAPWWKTDYFEVRYENPQDNRRYFYQLDGEGIRQELLAFLYSIENKNGKTDAYIKKEISIGISSVIEDFEKGNDVIYLERNW